MGKIVCAGLGPGDPDLMSVKAYRLVSTAKKIAYFRKKGTQGQARKIVDSLLSKHVNEYPMEYPATTEISFKSKDYNTTLAQFYDNWANQLVGLSQDEDIVVLCEGDPFFYGSYMHLYTRLEGRVEQEVIPAITGMSACWHAVGYPMTWGDDVMSVLMGTLPERDLVAHIQNADALVIMKTGKNLPKIANALKCAGRIEKAWLVQYGAMSNEKVEPLAEADWKNCPYFATVIVHGQGRRP